MLVTLYYLLPFDQDVDPVMVTVIALGCAVLAVVVVWQVRTIGRSPYPGIRVVEALAFTVPGYVLLFVTTCFVMADTAVSNFTEPLTCRTPCTSRFTFTTVGFGDIAAKAKAPAWW